MAPPERGPDEAVQRVIAALLPGRDRFIAELVAETEAEIDALDQDEHLRALLAASISENIIAALHIIANGIEPTTVDAPLPALTYARRLAQRDVPLTALLRAYRLGQARFLAFSLNETAALGGDNQAEIMIKLVNVAGSYVDHVSEQIAVAYGAERERWAQDRGVLRRHWVTQLLTAAQPDVARAEAALDYRIGATHLAAEMWIDRPVTDGDVASMFTTATTRLERALDATGRPLALPTDERDMQLWIPVGARHRTDAPRVAAEIDGARFPVRVALGTPQPGLAGFRRSARNVARAKTLALGAGDTAPTVVDFVDVAPVALLADDAGDLADFVTRTLGGLSLEGARPEWLRETLLAFLRNNRSYAATADELNVHRNTVHYRVQQALEAYGQPLEGDLLHLRLALEAARWRGPDALRNRP